MDFSLSFDEYDVYGFDIDHTLSKHDIPNLFDLLYSSFVTYLVDKKGYDKVLIEDFEIHKDFCTRGIVLDTEMGNFLKLAEDGTILRASHGTRFLSGEEIVEFYGKGRHWPHFEDLIEKVNNLGEKFRMFENFFDMPLMVVAARIVDILGEKAGGRLERYDVWKDVLEAAMDTYLPEQFEANQGGFFPEWKAHTSRYLVPCSDHVRDWLVRLRKRGRPLFLMTSSHADYATASMKFILGDDWQKYFDLTITNARKPGFFQTDRPFLNIEGTRETTVAHELEQGSIYSQGNAQTLVNFLAKLTGKDNPKVMYFGDSLRSDISPSKVHANWETVLILEEIESEQTAYCPEEAAAACDGGDGEEVMEPIAKRQRMFAPSQKERDYLTSTQWGSFFTDTHPFIRDQSTGPRRMNTLWGYMVRKYADVAIPQFDYVTDFPLDHRLNTFNHEKTYTWGFFPSVPKALLGPVVPAAENGDDGSRVNHH